MDARRENSWVYRRADLRVAIVATLLSVMLAACGGPAAPTTPPTPPLAVVATGVPNGVLVTWTDNSTTETGFVIYRSTTPIGEKDTDTFTEIGTTPKNTERYLDEDVNGNNAYRYKVAATNAAGESTQVEQDGDAVSPAPGTDLKLTLDGSGTVVVKGGGADTTCDADCTVAVAAGTQLVLTAKGSGGATFAGWSGDCRQAGTCTVTLDDDAAVTARFRRNVLTVALTGDSPATVTVSPADSETNDATCDLTPGAACAFAYNSQPSVSINLDIPSGSVSDGFGEHCSGYPTFCLVPVEGDTSVRVTVRHPPVAVVDSYTLFSGQITTIPVESGVLSNDLDTPGDVLEAYLDQDVKHGKLQLSKNGSFTYTSDPGSVGSDTFTYYAKDAYGNVSASVPVTLVIAPSTTNVLISIDTFTYDGSPKAVTVITNPPGLTHTTTYAQGGTPVTNPTNAGTYDVNVAITQAGYTGTATGTLTIKPAPLTIKADDKNKTYDGQPYTPFTATYTGFVNGEDESVLSGPLTYSGDATIATNVGTYPITASGQTSTNYTITYATGTLTIKPALLTIKAEDKIKTYDGQPYTPFTATYSGFVNGETKADLTGTLTYSGPASTSTAVGTYTITPGGQTSTNYTITYENGTLTINAAATPITISNNTPTYNGLPKAVTVTTNPPGLTNTITYSQGDTPVTNPTNAGTYDVKVAITQAGYAGTTTGTLTIKPAPLTIKADDKNKTYDGQPYTPFTATYSGFVNGETKSKLSGTLTFSSNATEATAVGTYPITPTGQTSTNYDITYENGTLTINAQANRAPTADDQDDVTTLQDASVQITLTGNDPDGDDLDFIVVNNPTHGGLVPPTGNAAQRLYTPTTGYIGTDSFTFKTSDGDLQSVPATVTINVEDFEGTLPSVTPSASNCDGITKNSKCVVSVSFAGSPDAYRGAEFDFSSSGFTLDSSAAGDDVSPHCLIGNGSTHVVLACAAEDRFNAGELALLTLRRSSAAASDLIISKVFLATTTLTRIAIDGGRLRVE